MSAPRINEGSPHPLGAVWDGKGTNFAVFSEHASRVEVYQASPVASIGNWKSPVLLMQSDDDRDVAFGQTVDLVPLLRAHAIPYELIVFPDETHDSLMWRTWVRNFGATADFFERTLVRGEAIRTTPPEYTLGGATLPHTGH